VVPAVASDLEFEEVKDALIGVMAMGHIAAWDFTQELPRLSRRWAQHGRAFAPEDTSAYRAFEQWMRRLGMTACTSDAGPIRRRLGRYEW